ncbi:hypothetical protein [Pseudomonas chlororaphis]|uniref:nSTAND1 domain-containing NTPase n=1 Tax=Pseudomonas chlororaphis TaxID=587753 RepID=UPI0023675A23|nr:hypothetical protein [Pseudomonas chlororaphis]WDH32402.1 hypothetical protein PUP62_16170 [Pseudomonas chlororaphis]WDH38486.1 hypothetical protein PUP51_16175 [Pseudomonas chlororaphis]
MSDLDTAISNAQDPTSELWAAAAVQESFRSGDLLAQWYLHHSEADEKLRESALMTSIAIQDVAKPAFTSNGEPALRLPSSVRMHVLKGFGVRRARAAFNILPESALTAVERMLRAMLDGEEMPVDVHDREQLTALRVATSCAVAAGVSPNVTEEQLASMVQRLDLMLALGGADLHRFVGREKDLAILHKLWREHAVGAAIEGPGGMGKSLLVSCFVSEVLKGEVNPALKPSMRRGRLTSSQHPPVVFHFDFDRRDLQNRSGNFSSLDTLTNELMRQARRWLPPASIDSLVSDGPNIAGFALETASFSRSNRNYHGRGEQITELARLFNRMPDQSPPRIILVFDSMEQILGFDDEATYSIFLIAQQMERGGAQPFVICVSRNFAACTGIVNQLESLINLEQFSDDEAKTYLTNEALRRGVMLDDAALNRVIATVGRSPLALRLAVSLMEKDKDAFDTRHWLQNLRNNPERIQANLYDRVLKRIHDKDLVKVARPGLLVRRLTSGVIRHILAGPCEIDESDEVARQLIHKAGKEGQLFSVNSSDPDPDALWHRTDVRALMLADLDTEINETVARQINEAAVAFYAASHDVISRTEELYHRLRLAQGAAELDPRWSDAAGASLRAALDELPPQSRIYVRRRLGSASLSARKDAGSGTSADRELREVVRRELQAVADGATPMKTLASFGIDQMHGSFADLYADALLSQGRLDELLAGATKLVATGDAPPSVLMAVSSIAASVLEGLGRFSEAFESWQTAVDSAPINDAQSIHMAVAARVGALRTARKLDEIRHFAAFSSCRTKMIDETLSLAIGILPDLSLRAVEARETVAELSDPKSENVVPEMLFRVFADLVGSGEAFPRLAEQPERLSELASKFGFRAASLREFSSYLSKWVYGGDQGLVIELMRDEIAWTIERAVGRGTP